jgi:hypothetical protein
VILGGAPRRSQRDERSEIPDLLGQLQASVDRAKADRRTARTVPCDRTDRHPSHTYVATAKSGVDLYCLGRDA